MLGMKAFGKVPFVLTTLIALAVIDYLLSLPADYTTAQGKLTPTHGPDGLTPHGDRHAERGR